MSTIVYIKSFIKGHKLSMFCCNKRWWNYVKCNRFRSYGSDV